MVKQLKIAPTCFETLNFIENYPYLNV